MTRTGTNESVPDAGEAAWLVALDGQPTPMSLDELDGAFRDGVIDESTLVWSPGMLDWRALGEVIGAEDHEAPLGLAEPAEEPMDDDAMPKVDPRLWTLSDEARAARRAEAKEADTSEEEPTDETELGADDLEEDDTPWGSPRQLQSVAVFTPGLAVPSATPRAKPPQAVPSLSKPAQSVPPRSSAAQSVPPRSKPAQSVPPRVSSVSRVPPPPRSRTLPPGPKALDTLPPPVLNITAFESTAPMVRTLSEPVIPIQPPPPGWNWRPWAAAAGAVFGLSMYGLSVLDLAASSSDGPKRDAVVAAAEPLPAPDAKAPKLPPAARSAALGDTGDTPVTAAVMPRAPQAVADDIPSLRAAEPERSALVSAPRKATKKGSRFAKKKKKASRSKAATKSRSKQPAWLAKFKANAR